VNTQASRLVIGSAQLDYATAANSPGDLKTGQFVNVRISGTGANGILQIGSFLASTRAPSDAARVVTEGVVVAPVRSERPATVSVDFFSGSNPWIGTFAAHLRKLEPSLNATYAVQCAVANIHQAGHLPPKEAANVVAGDRARPEELAAHTEHSGRYRVMFAK
jgi:hypothetical protein